MSASREESSAREQRALMRWKPARRWYHPPLAALVIATSRFVTTKLNSLTIEGLDRFYAASRRGSRGLLTFSNHVSMFDDPLLIANFAPRRYEDIRWVASDAINFFGSAWKAWLFTAGRQGSRFTNRRHRGAPSVLCWHQFHSHGSQ